MQSKHQISIEQDWVQTLTILAEAYERISIMKMQQVRSSVLTTRQFLEGLGEIFFDVKQSYKDQLEQMAKQKLRQESKVVLVVLTANPSLYGNIIREVFNLFLKSHNRQNEVVVIGKIGKAMAEETKIRFTYFDLPDGHTLQDELGKIVAFLVQFDKVNVFYGKFANVVTQVATVSSVSGEETFQNESEQPQIQQIAFRFEPSLENIWQFFQNQVISSLFKQTVHEAELSRHAARIKAMEEVLSNTEKQALKLRIAQRQFKNWLSNKKQIQTIAGINLWKGKI